MLKIGLDIGTGFVKCVSDYGKIRFPTLYVKRIHGNWSNKVTEAVGADALQMLDTMGASAIRPIVRGQPDPRYHKQVELLIRECIDRIFGAARIAVDPSRKVKIVVGLPYYAFDQREAITRIVKKTLNVETCTTVAQASGTLVDLGRRNGIVVSIGQGTTEILVIEEYEVIDGESSTWASDFVTRKIGKFAHLDVASLVQNKERCKKYARILADNLANEINDVAKSYRTKYPIAISGGGLLIPGMHNELVESLKEFKILIPNDPVMSNANGLYKLIG